MTYSYTQLAHYLACPLRYRYRYLDGWQEKEVRANMVFGRAFEKALGASFRREDCGQALFDEWSVYRSHLLEYSNGDTWDRILEQGVRMLERFVQDDRIRIPRPRQNLQIKAIRPLAGGNDFVAYIDAIGRLDGQRTIIDWKTTSARYPEEPQGLLTLDPQLVCYSWVTGEANVAFVVFVRKRLPEIQYLRATISPEQREQFGRLIEDTVGQIGSARFPAHSGIRFPQNGCVSCPHLGLCLGRQDLVDSKLTRRLGGELDWLDQLAC
ncbi:MAG TPA: PD-(D/E)XK nuclease family protein [bacterium]|nr:PD-(D/E)XK nuclease family protein [bacterium]